MIWQVLAAAGMGFASALLPVINAEAFQAASSLLQPPPVVMACVVALAVGQTGGKLVIFGAARRGATRWRSAPHVRSSRMPWRRPTRTGLDAPSPGWVARTSTRLLQWLSHPVGGPTTVAISATVGLPPLAIVSAAAGASTIRCLPFALACLTGRFLRFAALAGLLAAITS